MKCPPYLVGALDQKPLIALGNWSTFCWFWSTFLWCLLRFDSGPISVGILKFCQGSRCYTLNPLLDPADNFRHLISFDPLVVTHPYTLHGSTIGMEWWCFECYAPAKMVVLLVDNGVGRKLSLWTIEAPDGEMGWKQDENYQYSKWSKLEPEISFAVRVATGDGL